MKTSAFYLPRNEVHRYSLHTCRQEPTITMHALDNIQMHREIVADIIARTYFIAKEVLAI